MDFANVAVPVSFSVFVMVVGAVLGGRFINGVGGAMAFRILVAVPVALTAAAMVPAALRAALFEIDAQRINPYYGMAYNVIIYAVASVALYGVLWPTAAMVIAKKYPRRLWLPLPKRRRNRHYAGMTFKDAVAKRVEELSK